MRWCRHHDHHVGSGGGDVGAHAQPLGQRHGIRGIGARELRRAGEPLPRAPDARLDLVDDHEDAVLRAQRADVGEEALRRFDDAALALQRLEDVLGHELTSPSSRTSLVPALSRRASLSPLIPVLVTGIQPTCVCAAGRVFQPKDLGWLDPCDKHRDEGSERGKQASCLNEGASRGPLGALRLHPFSPASAF